MDVRFHQPVEMNHSGHGAHINRAMQHLPAAIAHSANHPGRGGDGQRNHQDKSRESHRDVRALHYVGPNAAKIQHLVEAKINAEVHEGVEKSEQSQHAAEADQLRQAKYFYLAQRRYRKRDGKKPKYPVARGVLEELGWIRAPFAVEPFPDQDSERHQAQREHNYFCPFADKQAIHSIVTFSNFSSSPCRCRGWLLDPHSRCTSAFSYS